MTGVGTPAMPGVFGAEGRPPAGAPFLDMWKALILAARSGLELRVPPLPLTVGAGRLAAETLPSGVDEGVMLGVAAMADKLCSGRRGRPGEVTLDEGESERSERDSWIASGGGGEDGAEEELVLSSEEKDLTSSSEVFDKGSMVVSHPKCDFTLVGDPYGCGPELLLISV